MQRATPSSAFQKDANEQAAFRPKHFIFLPPSMLLPVPSLPACLMTFLHPRQRQRARNQRQQRRRHRLFVGLPLASQRQFVFLLPRPRGERLGMAKETTGAQDTSWEAPPVNVQHVRKHWLMVQGGLERARQLILREMKLPLSVLPFLGRYARNLIPFRIN